MPVALRATEADAGTLATARQTRSSTSSCSPSRTRSDGEADALLDVKLHVVADALCVAIETTDVVALGDAACEGVTDGLGVVKGDAFNDARWQTATRSSSTTRSR